MRLPVRVVIHIGSAPDSSDAKPRRDLAVSSAEDSGTRLSTVAEVDISWQPGSPRISLLSDDEQLGDLSLHWLSEGDPYFAEALEHALAGGCDVTITLQRTDV